jgi:hypothetical protein
VGAHEIFQNDNHFSCFWATLHYSGKGVTTYRNGSMYENQALGFGKIGF